MVNGKRGRIPAEERKRIGQTAYKRQLAYQRLGIREQDVECFPFFRANLRRIGRQLNQDRAKDAPLVHPFDLLQSAEDDNARRVWRAYNSVPPSFRRLLRPEAFCLAGGLSPKDVLVHIAVVAISQGVQLSSILGAVWLPNVVMKSIERGLRDDGVKDRQMMFRAVGLLPTRG
jgi:hypothetical protein